MLEIEIHIIFIVDEGGFHQGIISSGPCACSAYRQSVADTRISAPVRKPQISDGRCYFVLHRNTFTAGIVVIKADPLISAVAFYILVRITGGIKMNFKYIRIAGQIAKIGI